MDLAGQNPGPQAVPVTITDDDNPVVTIAANRSKVTFPGYFGPTFTLRRATTATAASLTVPVDLTLTGESPYANDLPLTRTVTIPAGETFREFTVGLVSQFPAGAALESGVLTATVQAAADYDLGADDVASVDIVPFMTVRIEQPSYTVDEGAGTLEVRIIAQTGEGAPWPPLRATDSSLTAFAPLTGFTVSTVTASDTAFYDQDFVPLNGFATFNVADFVPVGDTWRREETVTVTILDDAANDDGEIFEFRLERTSGLDFRIQCVNDDRTFETCGTPVPVTITDNDAPVEVTPPDDALVGNTGQTGTGDHRLVGGAVSVDGNQPEHTQAQRFTTGGDTRGYTLTAIDVLVDDFRTEARPRVSIHAVASGNPGNHLFNLVNPATPVDNAVNTFTVPNGEYLAPDTDYFVVFRDRRTTGVLQAYDLNDTDSGADDPGAAVGWSLADESLSRVNSAAWVSDTGKLQIAVRGTVNGAQMVTVAAAEPRVNYLEGPLAASAATFTVTRTRIVTETGATTDEALTVTVLLTPTGGAYLDDAQQPQTHMVTILAGELSMDLVIPGDDLRLPAAAPVENGTLTATVQSGRGYGVGAANEASVEIVPFMTVRFEELEYTVVEGTGIALPMQLVKIIARTGDGAAQPAADVTVEVRAQEGSAVVRTLANNGGYVGDYVELPDQSVTFAAASFEKVGPAWQLEKTVYSVQILDDDNYEGEEAFEIKLEAPAAGLADGILLVNAVFAMPGDQSVTVTIDDIADASTDATLSGLTVNDGTTDRTIDLASPPYALNVDNAVDEVTLTATLSDAGATVSVTLNGTTIADGDFSDGITVPSLVEGANEIVLTVTAEDTTTVQIYTVTVRRVAPEIAVLGNDVEIMSGASRPLAADGTNFGSVSLLDETGANEVVERTFTVTNTGTGVLTIVGAPAVPGVPGVPGVVGRPGFIGPDGTVIPAIPAVPPVLAVAAIPSVRVSLELPPGGRPGVFNVTQQPAGEVAPGDSTTFTIQFDPPGAGGHSAYVSLEHDDADENPFRFRIGGNGVAPQLGLSGPGRDLLTGDRTALFGPVEVASASTDVIFTVANTGAGPLHLGPGRGDPERRRSGGLHRGDATRHDGGGERDGDLHDPV